MARCASRTDSRVHRMRPVNSLGRMSFLPGPRTRAAKLRGQRNQCRRESAREVVCPVLINETDDPGVKEAVGFPCAINRAF
jgi:hypothetical protein